MSGKSEKIALISLLLLWTCIAVTGYPTARDLDPNDFDPDFWRQFSEADTMTTDQPEPDITPEGSEEYAPEVEEEEGEEGGEGGEGAFDYPGGEGEGMGLETDDVNHTGLPCGVGLAGDPPEDWSIDVVVDGDLIEPEWPVMDRHWNRPFEVPYFPDFRRHFDQFNK